MGNELDEVRYFLYAWRGLSTKQILGLSASTMKPRKQRSLKVYAEDLLIRLFVDNVFLHKYFKCHRLSSRSFFIRNRQFHVCARCTGLISGYLISPVFLLILEPAYKAFFFFCAALIMDGVSQLLKWRESNNSLRFITGLGTGATLLAFIAGIIVHALKLN